MQKVKYLFIVQLFLLINTIDGQAQKSNYFPDNCWGVYTWGGGLENVNPVEYPLVKGAPIIMNWSDVEPEPGKFRFDEVIRKKLEYAEKHNYYTFLKIWVAPRAPKWLYTKGVPEVEMTKTINPLGKPRDWTFQHYLDPEYIVFYHRLIEEFGKYVLSLPKNLQDRILYIQSAEGSTGDGGPYKGDPLDSKYTISNAEWGDFRMQTWEVFKKSFTNTKGVLVKPILVNQDSNTEKEYNWLINNFPVIGLKHGMFSHGYDISDTKKRLNYWNEFNKKNAEKGIETFARGEQDGEWAVYGWHTKNSALAFYWSGIFASYCGIDMWNIPTKAAIGLTHKDGLGFFNKYAGQRNPKTAKVAFCAFRKGLNAADKETYPESVYGVCDRKNVDRYVKIAAAFSQFGAYQGDSEKATGGGMMNRQSKDYNDVGWDITEGNYSRFINQIDAEETSEGWWHVGPEDSIYGRFARSIKMNNGKGSLFFDVNDDFAATTKKVEIRLIWLDKGFGEWAVFYNSNKKAEEKLFVIKNTNSGKWMEKIVVMDNVAFANKGERKSDLIIRANSNETTIFHLMELAKK
jgi:hypothetical protein